MHTLILLMLLAAPAPAECTKLVFDEFCLGGELDRAEQPPIETKGASLDYGGGVTLHITRNDRIFRVARTESPNAERFADLLTKLTSIYGSPVERSARKGGGGSSRWINDRLQVYLGMHYGVLMLEYTDRVLEAEHAAANRATPSDSGL